MANSDLYRCIAQAGLKTGLYLDDTQWKPKRPEPRHTNGPESSFASPLSFTLRPVEEYMKHYRGSWTRLTIEAVIDEMFVSSGDSDDDELGTALIFEVCFHLPYTSGFVSADATFLIEEVLERIEDFAQSYPDEAEALLDLSPRWDMHLEGEIIYDPQSGDPILVDFGMYFSLYLGINVFAAPDEAFTNQLAAVGEDSPIGQGIQDTMHRLALLFRWLDMEAQPQFPLELPED